MKKESNGVIMHWNRKGFVINKNECPPDLWIKFSEHDSVRIPMKAFKANLD